MIQKFVRHPFALIARLTAFLTIIGAMALMSGLVVAQVVQPDLLTATSFSVLAGTTVTNTGATIIGPPVGSPALGGDLGVHPGSSVTNFPPGFVLPPGVIHAADAVALQAKSDLTATYLSIAGITPCAALPASIGTLTVTPGVYCFTSDVLFTTPSTGLTLDLQGNADSLFILSHNVLSPPANGAPLPASLVRRTAGCTRYFKAAWLGCSGVGLPSHS